MTAQPIELTAALRRKRRRIMPADGTHGPTFASLGVPAPLTTAVAAAGIDAPFPIQAAVVGPEQARVPAPHMRPGSP